MTELRNANISLLVGAVILFTGAFLFRDSGEAAVQVVALIAFIATFGLFFILVERKRRRSRGH